MWQCENRSNPRRRRQMTTIVSTPGWRRWIAPLYGGIALCLTWLPQPLPATPVGGQLPVARSITQGTPGESAVCTVWNGGLGVTQPVPADIVSQFGCDTIRIASDPSPTASVQRQRKRRSHHRPGAVMREQRVFSAELLRGQKEESHPHELPLTELGFTARKAFGALTYPSVISPVIPRQYRTDLQTILINTAIRNVAPKWNDSFPTNSAKSTVTTDWTANLLARHTAKRRAERPPKPLNGLSARRATATSAANGSTITDRSARLKTAGGTPPPITSRISAWHPALETSMTLGVLALTGLLFGHPSVQSRVRRTDTRCRATGVPPMLVGWTPGNPSAI